MHFVQHGLREFLTRPRDYSPVVARHLLFDPDGLLATAAFSGSIRLRFGPNKSRTSALKIEHWWTVNTMHVWIRRPYPPSHVVN